MISEDNLHKERKDLEGQLSKQKGNTSAKQRNAKNVMDLKDLYNNT